MNLDCGLCHVRDWRLADRLSLLRLANNPKVARNLSHRFPHPYGEAAGGIGIDVGQGIYARSARFGYWLGEPHWGRGIMSAAVKATSDYLLQHTDLVRLEAPVFEWNPSSMRVLEKCGFVREGVQRKSIVKDGQIIDGVMYARTR